MRKRALALLAGMLAVGSLLLVGCNKKNDKPIDTTPIASVTETQHEESTTEPPATSAEAEVTTVESEGTTTVPEVTETEPETTVTESDTTATAPTETTTEPETTVTEPELTETEPVATETIPDDSPLPQPETVVASPVTNFRYKGHISFINGTAFDLDGYRDMLTSPKVHVVPEVSGITTDEGNVLYLSGYAAMNGGQEGIYWSVDGETWYSFVGGSYSDAGEELVGELTDSHSAWMLTGVFEENVVFSGVAADLSAYVGQTVTVKVAVGGTQNGLCHFLTLEVTVGDTNEGDDENGDEGGLPSLNGKTPYEAYESVRNQIDGILSNCQEHSITNQYLSFMGESALMQTVESVSKVNGNDMESIVTTVNYLESTSSVMKSYYKGGWLYGDQDGTTFKAQLTKEQMYEIVYGAGAAGEEKILNMPESWFTDVVFTENEDGTYGIRIMMSGERVAEVIDRLGIADMTALGMEISDLCYSIILDADGNLVSIVYTFRLTMELEGEIMAIDSESIITYTNVGTTTITLPEGCEGYVDVTDQLVG